MQKNNFFESKGPFTLRELFLDHKINSDVKIHDIKTLFNSSSFNISFLDSVNYKSQAKLTKAASCITTEKLKKFLPNKCIPIIVKNVLFELAKVTKTFYPSADIDYPDLSLKTATISSYPGVKFGNNVLIGKNVKLGENTIIGSNTIIEHDVVVGKNCIIGSQIMIKNSIIGNDVVFIIFRPD